jgi:hypothetical protein
LSNRTRGGYQIPPHYRVRHDKIDAAGVITIRYNSHLHHIGLSKYLRGTNVTVLIDDRDIRVLDHNTGELIRELVLDPPVTTNPAASNAETHPKTGCRCKPYLGTPVNDVPRHHPRHHRSYLLNRILARYWLGLTATPERRDGLEDSSISNSDPTAS